MKLLKVRLMGGYSCTGVYVGGASPNSLSWPEISRSYWLLRLNIESFCGNVVVAVLLSQPDELVCDCLVVILSRLDGRVWTPAVVPGTLLPPPWASSQGHLGVMLKPSSNDSRYEGSEVHSGLHRH